MNNFSKKAKLGNTCQSYSIDYQYLFQFLSYRLGAPGGLVRFAPGALVFGALVLGAFPPASLLF
jgi:hypothetical protein